MDSHHKAPDLKAIQNVMGGTLIWVGAAFLAFMLFIFVTLRIEEVLSRIPPQLQG